jgi:membrane protein
VNCLEEDELIAQLERDGAKPHYVLIANPARISVERIYARFVIDRKELAYQLKSSDIDAGMLLAALENDKLSVSLASLLAARRELARLAEANGQPSGLPHPAA